ncbi:MAG: hypothetical protein DME19_12585 [Verrucomicrobia bacterium]|nr:MAG: hypothetical protein DME19_12585 [Verrucomicrobiota bacterium]
MQFSFSSDVALPKVWYQGGKTFDETQRDLAACRMGAARINSSLAMVNLGFFLANEGNKKDLINNCMIAKGYSLIKRNTLPPGVTGVPEWRASSRCVAGVTGAGSLSRTLRDVTHLASI